MMFHVLAVLQTVADSVYNSIPVPKIISSIPFLGSLIGSALLGTIKKLIGPLDSVILNFLKPFQPILVLALGFLTPLVAKLFTDIDPNSTNIALMAAPLGTIIAIVIREINDKISKSK